MNEKKSNICLELLTILQKETDSDHILNAQTLADRIGCGRKTIYANIELLRSHGIDIQQEKGTRFGYYIDQRTFEPGELKFLSDAIQSCRCLSPKKTEEMLKKLSSLASASQARELRRNTSFYNRPKTLNSSICDIAEVLQAAISNNHRVSFQYCDLTVRKTLEPRHGGAFYDVSPLLLAVSDSNYYLIGHDEQADKIKHYRLDKIMHVSETNQQRNKSVVSRRIDSGVYTGKMFNMFSGSKEYSVSISGPAASVGIVLDRFGNDILVRPDEDRFVAHVCVSVSPQFFGWLSGLGPGFRIESPANIRTEYLEYLSSIRNAYQA